MFAYKGDCFEFFFTVFHGEITRFPIQMVSHLLKDRAA